MERDPRGWNVSPAPDGRGRPEKKEPRQRTPRPPRIGWRWVAFVAVAFALNYALATAFGPKENPQVTVPYTPYFLQQVRGDNVKEISSTGETIEGHFRKDVTYKKTKTDRF